MHGPAELLDRMRRRRAIATSCAVHAAALAALALIARRDDPALAMLPAAPPLDMTPTAPVVSATVSVDVDVVAMTEGKAAPLAGGSARAPAFRARVRPGLPEARLLPATLPQANAPDAPVTVVAPDVTPAAEVAPPDERSALLALAMPGEPGGPDGHDETETGGGGDATGPGFGGDDRGGGGRLRRELRARVVGDSPPRRNQTGARPFISGLEATALRMRDFFPRLPESLWSRRGPYVVTLDVCVSERGFVDHVTLRSSAAPTLDAMVLAAVTTWRYRPRLVAGVRSPFCHGVTIKYERW